MSNNPRISVVMSAFNGEKFIKGAIDSILNQTFSDFEFIIVDNASTDKTNEIILSCHDPRIVFIKNDSNLGQTKALNIGIRQARGEFIARMDADDISLPPRLELQYKCLSQNASLGVVGTWFTEIDEKGKHLKYFTMPTDPLEIKCYLISPGELGYYCLAHPTVLIRRKVLLDVGLYDENYRTQDYDLWVRIVKKYPIANLNRFLVKHRVVDLQQSRRFKDEVRMECQKIIASNVSHYLSHSSEKELLALVRMLQYKPQESKEDGKQVLKVFNSFFDKYLGSDSGAKTAEKIRNKIVLFYLPQLFKTNSRYSLRQSLKIFSRNPDLFFCLKVYRKIARVIGG